MENKGTKNTKKAKASLPAEALDQHSLGDVGSVKAGYEYLLAHKITVPIYDLSVQFCDRWISKHSRTYDQMVQAARSGMQNISEGYKQQGLKGYIKLTGVSRGSLEELLKDYLAYARQNKLAIWEKEKHRTEGGLSEKLYKERRSYRGY